ncbi:DUF2218 domain-containing protein [Sinomonas susongensis]|uniref:DUF2218 domain-containing protein n=1 Tax=Sinomonas susongensis TaxID=1324851 RepID=UPI003CCC5FF9
MNAKCVEWPACRPERRITTTQRSAALVRTTRPARWGRQLVTDLASQGCGVWSDTTGQGWIQLELGRLELRCSSAGLYRAVEGDTYALDEFEEVAGNHLARFSPCGALQVGWTRPDGSRGTEQGPPLPPNRSTARI